MRDPYEILGVKRGATLDEVKAAFRRASKQRHPDMPGGSNEALVELNTAYAFVLNELKHGFQQQQKEEPKRQQSAGTGEGAWHDVGEDTSHDARRDAYWRNLYRDIDDELETLRRAAEQYDEQLRRMRSAAWRTGQHAAWAKLTWDDLFGFFRRTARSGLKGVALLFAALVGVGSVLVEANFVSALILLGSGIGFAFSLALKSDKGGVSERRAALVRHYDHLVAAGAQRALPLSPGDDKRADSARADLQIRAGGRHGRTDDRRRARVLCHRRDRREHFATAGRRRDPSPAHSAACAADRPATACAVADALRDANGRAPYAAGHASAATTLQTPTPPEPRTLLASQGAILKFVFGVPYHLKVRNGFSTSLHATQGKVALASADGAVGECLDALDFPSRPGAGPWREIDRTLHACGGDAIMTVSASR